MAECNLFCDGFLRSFDGWLRGGRFFDRVAQNFHLEPGAHLAVQLDGHVVVAQGLQRLVQLDLAAIDIKAPGPQFRSNASDEDGNRRAGRFRRICG